MRKPKNGKTPKVRITISLDKKTLDKLDRLTNNRSEYIENLLERFAK